jgi:mycothiol synthase
VPEQAWSLYRSGMASADEWPVGVTARPIERTDVQAWAELLAAIETADQQGEHYDADDLLEELEDPKLVAADDTIGLWADGLMVGYGSVRGPDAVVDVHRLRTEGAVHPHWRGRGLGSALVDWLTRRAAAMHAERQPGVAGEINTNAISTNASALKLLSARGYKPCRYFFQMGRALGTDPVPEVVVPDGFRVLTFDPSYDEMVRLAHNEVFLDHWGSTPRDPDTWKTWFTGARAFRPGVSFLVLDGERIAAYALGYEYVADTAVTGIRDVYIGQVGTRREYRGQGLARTALCRVIAAAQEAGYQRASLGVDADNPTGALGLYEKLGFRTRTETITCRLPIRTA